MKKLLLSFGLVLAFGTVNAQVIVQQTNPNQVAYNFTQTSGWDLDMSVPGAYVWDTLAVSGTDTLGCTAVTGVAGKIALIYRGSCTFASKVEAAQAAGAVGVIIVNNVPGAPIVMGGSPAGTVTIPVVMLSQADGAALRVLMASGPVKMYIGNKTGFYVNDLGFTPSDVMRANTGATPTMLAQNGTEYSVTPLASVYNYGSANQSNITLTATIVGPSGSVYNQTSAPFSIVSGDTFDVTTLPAYTPTSWPVGSYTFTYTINYGNTDDFTQDNSIVTTFDITNDLFALAPLTSGLPTSDGGSKSSSSTTSFTTCLAFRDAHASRVGVHGIYFSGVTASTEVILGLEVLGYIYKWDDSFTDLNDANLAFNTLTEVASGSYTFESELQDTMVYCQLNTPVVLLDNQRYLFCVTDYSNKIYFGYNSATKYILNENINLQPLYPIQSDDTWYAGGFTGSPVPALGVRMFPAAQLGIAENVIEGSVYPNPAKDVVTVQVNAEGDATLKITDLAGRTIATENVKVENGQFKVNTSAMTAGTYVFNVEYANGTASRMNVVIAK